MIKSKRGTEHPKNYYVRQSRIAAKEKVDRKANKKQWLYFECPK